MLSLDVLAVALAVEGTLIAAALGGLVVLRVFLVWRARQVEAGVRRPRPSAHAAASTPGLGPRLRGKGSRRWVTEAGHGLRGRRHYRPLRESAGVASTSVPAVTPPGGCRWRQTLTAVTPGTDMPVGV